MYYCHYSVVGPVPALVSQLLNSTCTPIAAAKTRLQARSLRQPSSPRYHRAEGGAGNDTACSPAAILAWVRDLLADRIDADAALPSWVALKAQLAARFPDCDVAGIKTQCCDMLQGADVDSGSLLSETKDVTVWEQNRYYPIVGWSQKLLPTDRGGPYVDHDTNVVHPDLDGITPPTGWTWANGDGWVVDSRPRLGGDSHGDKDGWAYATDWTRQFCSQKPCRTL